MKRCAVNMKGRVPNRPAPRPAPSSFRPNAVDRGTGRARRWRTSSSCGASRPNVPEMRPLRFPRRPQVDIQAESPPTSRRLTLICPLGRPGAITAALIKRSGRSCRGFGPAIRCNANDLRAILATRRALRVRLSWPAKCASFSTSQTPRHKSGGRAFRE